MSLRRKLARWLLGDDDAPADGADLADEPAGWASGLRVAGDATTDLPVADVTSVLPRQRPLAERQSPLGEHAATTQLPSNLVLGSAEHRVADVELPDFYRPQAPVPAPRPYDDPGLLSRYSGYDRADLREAWQLVNERVETLMLTFYAELFIRLPEAMTMFPPQMTQQRHDFAKALLQWVLADDPEEMALHLKQLGADHRKFDVEPRHYEVAGQALVSAWQMLAGDRWQPRHEAAVLGSYARLASVMIDGAMKTLHEPATWTARVVEHHRVLHDFAVIRVQPDAPYAFRPGQYLTLELANRPREWRQMSIASAPRADNTFEIHVRAVGATGVSAALVMHTAVGDRLRLGPPRGNDLVVEPGTVPGGVLCVASGTGAAPITAVVESMLDWPAPTPVYAFLGGRTRHDIYPARRLNELIAARGLATGAQVFGVVSDDPEYSGYRGRVESVVPGLADWAAMGVDVLIAGPNPMIAATVRNLSEVGVGLDKIHFDQYEVAA